MKLAISGKGGVGKSTLAAALALLLAKKKQKVLAVDADPDANLASALGLPENIREQIVPISRQIDLIEERTGAKIKQYGQIFKLNPHVADVAGKFAVHYQGIDLLVLGAVDRGGKGCACPESVFLRALVTDLVLYKDENLIMDMEPGVEHLGRATAQGVDTMIVIVEPGQRAVDSSRRIIRLARDIGLKNVRLVANKIRSSQDEEFIRGMFAGHDLIGLIPYSEDIRLADLNGKSVLHGLDKQIITAFGNILQKIKP